MVVAASQAILYMQNIPISLSNMGFLSLLIFFFLFTYQSLNLFKIYCILLGDTFFLDSKTVYLSGSCNQRLFDMVVRQRRYQIFTILF